MGLEKRWVLGEARPPALRAEEARIPAFSNSFAVTTALRLHRIDNADLLLSRLLCLSISSKHHVHVHVDK